MFPDDAGSDVVGDGVVSHIAGGHQDVVVLECLLVDRSSRWHGRILAHDARRRALGWAGTVVVMAFVLSPRSRRAALVAATAVSAAILLSGCEKPAPGVSVFSGTTTEHRKAVCWAFESEALDPGQCTQDLLTEASAGEVVARIPVVPGDTVGISVDPVVAKSGWTPVIGQQRLVSTPLETTYYRFTYPDLQEVPEDGVLLQIVAGRGDSTRGIWVFRLDRA